MQTVASTFQTSLFDTGSPFEPLLSATQGEMRELFVKALKERKLITLRDYQEEGRAAILTDIEQGKRTIGALATGCGKTELYLSIVKYCIENTGKRVLIIAHREELITQPAERILKGWELPCPGIVMGGLNMMHEQILIATVQTLTASKGKRLDKILANRDIGLLVIDECHHSTTDTYTQVISRVKEFCPDAWIVGMTATPRRSDEAGLLNIFDSVAYRLPIKTAINRGILTPFYGKVAKMQFSIKGIRQTKTGWDDHAIGDLMSAPNALDLIVAKWKEEAEDRATIAFTSSVEQAEKMAAAFNAEGIKAAWVSGNTEKNERRNIVAGYMAGEIQVLANCAVYTEGFDAKHTSCVLMAKPTKSPVAYAQMVGRGLRTFEGKVDCAVLQFIPVDAPLDMFMVGDLLGKPKAQQKAEQKARDDKFILDLFGIDSEEGGVEADPDDVIMKVIDTFNRRRNREIAWSFDPDTRVMACSLGRNKVLAVLCPNNNVIALAERNKEKRLASGKEWFKEWETALQERKMYHLYEMEDSKKLTRHYTADNLNEIEDAVQDFVARGDWWATHKKADWRNKPPSKERQFLARSLGVWQMGMTSGEMSDAITLALFIRLARQQKLLPPLTAQKARV